MDAHKFLDLAAQTALAVDPHLTKSNPRVGCVVVHHHQVIAVGAHEKLGAAHAEVNALKNCIPGWSNQKGQNIPDLQDCSVYVTLEPCVGCRGKKTPACTDLLIKLKPAEIIVGALDPHFPGQGVAQLKAAGIKVTVLNSPHHENLNPWFKTWIRQSKPFITLKVAQSLDGKITPPNQAYKKGHRSITGKETQMVVHNLRAYHQAILTSTETILEDNPKLDVRQAQNLDFSPTAPEVIVLGERKIPDKAKIFSVENRQVHFVKELEGLIPYCQKHNLASIMTECGGRLNSALLEAELIDQIEIFTAPIFCGEKAKPSFTPNKNLTGFELKHTKLLNKDLWLSFVDSSIR